MPATLTTGITLAEAAIDGAGNEVEWAQTAGGFNLFCYGYSAQAYIVEDGREFYQGQFGVVPGGFNPYASGQYAIGTTWLFKLTRAPEVPGPAFFKAKDI